MLTQKGVTAKEETFSQDELARQAMAWLIAKWATEGRRDGEDKPRTPSDKEVQALLDQIKHHAWKMCDVFKHGHGSYRVYVVKGRHIELGGIASETTD